MIVYYVKYIRTLQTYCCLGTFISATLLHDLRLKTDFTNRLFCLVSFLYRFLAIFGCDFYKNIFQLPNDLAESDSAVIKELLTR